MSNKETGGPAFPMPGMSGLPNGDFVYGEHGMTVRDYFAAKALTGVLYMVAHGAHSAGSSADGCAIEAYKLADAMLEARK